MAKGTSIDDVEAAVVAVKVLQDQVAGLLEAIKLLARRINAIEKQLPKGGADVL